MGVFTHISEEELSFFLNDYNLKNVESFIGINEGIQNTNYKARIDSKDFILVNGDTVFNLNLNDFVKSYKKKNLGCVALTPNNRNIHNYKLNNLSVKNNSLIEYR